MANCHSRVLMTKRANHGKHKHDSASLVNRSFDHDFATLARLQAAVLAMSLPLASMSNQIHENLPEACDCGRFMMFLS